MIYRRCSCLDERGKAFGNLPENAKPEQLARACPTLTNDRNHGRWGFYLSRGFDSSGKRLQTRVATFSNARAARSAYAAAKAKHDTGNFVETNRTRYSDWLDEWLSSRERRGDLKASTLDNYRRYVECDIKPSQLGRLRLTDIRRTEIRRFIDSLVTAERGATTIRRIVAVVQGSLTAALRDDLIATNPARGVRLPNVDAHEFEPWQPAQVGAFLDHTATHRLGVLFELAVFTGLRRGELLGLRWADVELARRELTVRSTRVQTAHGIIENSPKTSAGRRLVQLDDGAVGALVAWQIAQQSERETWGEAWAVNGWVFTYENGDPLKPQYVTRLFDVLRQSAGLPEMTFHGLRHMHASLLLASGADIALVSKRLGHSSIGITADIYMHLISDAGRRAAEGASALVPRVNAHKVHNTRGADNMQEALGPAMSA
jgi:integrase